jgi:hypothetical protein
MASDTVTVPFDGLRVEAQINGREPTIPMVLDTGAPGNSASVPRAVVERFDLPVDTTAVVGRSVVPAFGIDAPKYELEIDSIRIGGVVIRDVPATVSWTKRGGGDELGEGLLDAGLLRFLFDAIRYNYADSTFSMIRDVPEQDRPPNFAVMNDGWPVVTDATVRDSAIAGIIDTGNPWPHLRAASFPPSEETFVRSETYTGSYGGSDYALEFKYYEIPFTFPGGLHRQEMAIRKSFLGDRAYAYDALLGTGLWEEGALVLDYRNRRTYFQDVASDQ